MGVSAEGVYHVMRVPYVSQLYPVKAVVGCEGAALLMGMQYKGIATGVSLKRFLDVMPKSKTNPAKGFAGSPYVKSEKIRTTIYPAAIAEYANRYAPGMTRDISGAELETLKQEILNDNPVMIYATMYWRKPYYRSFMIDGQQQWLLRNNHAILLAGYDGAARKFYIADPYNEYNIKKPYFYWIEEDKLKPLYDERKWAVAVGLPVFEPTQTQIVPEAPQPQEEAPKIEVGSKVFRGREYSGFDWDGAVYLDAEDIFAKEGQGSLTYFAETGSCIARNEYHILDVNLNNAHLFEKNNVVGKLAMMPIVWEGKVYITQEDIVSLFERLGHQE